MVGFEQQQPLTLYVCKAIAIYYIKPTDSIYTERYMGSPSKEDNYYNYRVSSFKT